MKKNIIFLLGLFFIISQQSVNALPIRKEIRQNIRQEMEDEIKATLVPTISVLKEKFKNAATLPAGIRKEIREENQGLLDKIKNRTKEMIKERIRFGARLRGKIAAISGNQLTVSDNEGKNYSVLVTEKTQLRRRFWGKANLSEFKVGDEVNVIGSYSNEEKTEIKAVLIRNLSIQKRWGVFFGEVISLSDNSLVIKTNKRDQLTVYLTSASKIINRNGEPITMDGIKVGHKIRVKGVWDRDLKEIREVEEVKDFSLPPFLTPTASQE